MDDYQFIRDQFKDMDIGVLLLNAGCAQFGPFKEMTDDEIEGIVSTNALHVVYLAKALIP